MFWAGEEQISKAAGFGTVALTSRPLLEATLPVL